MSQFPDRGFVVRPLCPIGKALSLLCLTGALTTAALALTQTAPPSSNNSGHKDKPSNSTASPSTTAPVAPVPVDPDAPPDTPPEPQTAEQLPAQPPVVAWDGALLTIDADNSTLADVLKEVGTRTGASMDIPPAAYTERIFVHVGPGSVRDVISSLLYGTGFDYIVAAAEDDPDTLRSVVVTARGREDDSGVGVVAGASDTPGSGGAGGVFHGGIAQGVPSHEGMRMMRGWAAPGKPAFQADAESALAAEQAAKDSGGATDAADATGTASTASSTDTGSTAPNASGADQPSSASVSTPPSNASSTNDADSALAAASATASPSSTSSDPGDPSSGVSGLIQNMTRMFEQRRQIQAQQNQTQAPPQQH